MPSVQELLFRPFHSEKLTLTNRVVMAPMTRNHSQERIPTVETAAYYKRRAAANVGLIITEGTTINHIAATGYDDVPEFFGEAALTGWQHVVDEVHSVGGKIIPQIWHVGSMRKPGVGRDPDVPGYSPSGLVKPGKKRCYAMTDSDIADVIEAYAQAAENAEKLGFDGVEVHGAHGYLVDQFFWGGVNERCDRFGGNAVERTRFAAEVLQAIRARVSQHFPLIFRYSQWKQQDYSARLAENPQQLEQFLAPLVAAGVDIFDCSTRRFWESEFEPSTLNLAGWTKKLTGKPTITVGSVGLHGGFTDMEATNEVDHDFDKLAKRLEDDEFDLVAIGRALLADPNWAKKMKAGDFEKMSAYSLDALRKLY